ncbi:MAG: hypothetical protein IJD92_03975 [Bacilli bacterium]|nr:hypothetical protein [Bacilli bacterium]
MDKKAQFKEFVSKHPELVTFIKNKENTWQDFYEIYDIYGEDETAWNKYFENNTTNNSSIGELTSLFKNINMDNVQKHITNAQKAVSLIQELTNKGTTNIVNKTPRPITKFFGD